MNHQVPDDQPMIIVDSSDCGAFMPSALDDSGLDPYAIRAYLRIKRRAGCYGCYESVENMAKDCGIDIKRFRAAISTLIEEGYIAVKSRPGHSNIYRILPIPDPLRNRTPSEIGPPPKSVDQGYPIKEKEKRGNSSKFVPPTIAEMTVEFLARGSTETEAVSCWNWYEAADWYRSKGVRITRWKAAVAGWLNRKAERDTIATRAGANGNGKKLHDSTLFTTVEEQAAARGGLN